MLTRRTASIQQVRICEVLLFTQDLVVHVQLAAQVNKVLFINLFVGSQALSPSKSKQTNEPCICDIDMVYRMKVLTVSRIFLWQFEWRASENGTFQQTQLAGIAH